MRWPEETALTTMARGECQSKPSSVTEFELNNV